MKITVRVKSETDVTTGQVDQGAESVAVPSDGGAVDGRMQLWVDNSKVQEHGG